MQDLSTQRLILVLQSDPTYGHLIQEVLTENETHPQIVTIGHTQEALSFLRREGQYATSQRPDLILLDLDLTGETTGYDLLAVLKTDPDLRRIPIIVLTMSDRVEDIFNTYAVQGNCYVIRPGDRDQLVQIIRRIEDFWLKIVTLPRE
jgi:two-component system, chemotaxis family, response regulator Rcp1